MEESNSASTQAGGAAPGNGVVGAELQISWLWQAPNL